MDTLVPTPFSSFYGYMRESRKIKVLHIAWGFIPWRGGGLIQYAEDLMDHQLQNDYSVYYFCAGRKYPFSRETKLVSWLRKGINCFEIINSPIIHGGDFGTLRPDLDIFEPISETYFREVLDKVRPNIIHIHELAGLPSSLIDIAKKDYNLPVLMTLADYNLICPTLKLFTREEKKCNSFEVGESCLECCSKAFFDNRRDVVETVLLPFSNKFLNRYAPRRMLCCLLQFLGALQNAYKDDTFAVSVTRSDAYQLRRDINVSRLKKLDLLIARTKKVSDIYKYYLGDEVNIKIINPTLRHINYIEYSTVRISDRLRFVTLNGLSSIQKGGQLLLDAIKLLQKKGLTEKFELFVCGNVDKRLSKEVNKFKNVICVGPYDVNTLNRLLEGMHVGLIPSIWEEVFGYVGIEMLAKGLPLVANNVGGIPDYAKDGLNSFINYELTAEGFATIMEKLINNPAVVVKLSENISKERKISYQEHFSKIKEAYASIVR